MRSDDPAPEPDPDEDARFDDLVDPPFNPITGSTPYDPRFFGYPPQEPSHAEPSRPGKPPPSRDELRKPMSTREKLGCLLVAITIASLALARAFNEIG
jgi:hypothetical protein